MAEHVCEIISEWKQDQLLQNDIKKYVLGNLKRSEILDFVTRDYPQYTWSLSSLKRRLAYFDIKYVKLKTLKMLSEKKWKVLANC